MQGRAAAALLAAAETIRRHSPVLDSDDGLVTVSLTIKFARGSTHVRGVVFASEQVCSQQCTAVSRT